VIIPTLVRRWYASSKQESTAPLDRPHPGPGRHRAAGVHQEQDEVCPRGLPGGPRAGPRAAAAARPARPAPLDLVGRRGREGGGQVDLAHWPGGPPRPGDPPGGIPGRENAGLPRPRRLRALEPPDPERGPGAAAGSAGEGPSAPASTVRRRRRPVAVRGVLLGLRDRRDWWSWSGQWEWSRGECGWGCWGRPGWWGLGGLRLVPARPDRRAVPAARTPVARIGFIVIGRARPRGPRRVGCSSSCGASNGWRRRRCGSASRAAARMSSASVSSRPCHAAWAIGPRDDRSPAARPPRTRPHRRHLAQRGVRQHHPGQRPPAPPRSAGQHRFRPPAAGPEPLGVRVVFQSAAHTSARGLGTRRGRLDGQPEPVQELRAQFPLLRVHGANQQEPGACRTEQPVRSRS